MWWVGALRKVKTFKDSVACRNLELAVFENLNSDLNVTVRAAAGVAEDYCSKPPQMFLGLFNKERNMAFSIKNAKG